MPRPRQMASKKQGKSETKEHLDARARLKKNSVVKLVY